ncbi:MAG: F-type H+-transporting ATPase subunit epsilon [Candidatus Promineifilaceae bacterium]|jgi:F-type H+-transporting ATPase subunit epsilon
MALQDKIMPIELEIVTQERKVYSETVDAVNLPGIMGRMGILPNHSPLLTVLDFGEVIIRRNGVEEYFAIGGGIAEVNPDKIIILADSADHAEEIDEQKAEEARHAAEKAMTEGVPEDPGAYRMLEAQLRREQLRVDISRKRSRRGTPAVPDLSNTQRH